MCLNPTYLLFSFWKWWHADWNNANLSLASQHPSTPLRGQRALLTHTHTHACTRVHCHIRLIPASFSAQAMELRAPETEHAKNVEDPRKHVWHARGEQTTKNERNKKSKKKKSRTKKKKGLPTNLNQRSLYDHFAKFFLSQPCWIAFERWDKEGNAIIGCFCFSCWFLHRDWTGFLRPNGDLEFTIDQAM